MMYDLRKSRIKIKCMKIVSIQVMQDNEACVRYYSLIKKICTILFKFCYAGYRQEKVCIMVIVTFCRMEFQINL